MVLITLLTLSWFIKVYLHTDDNVTIVTMSCSLWSSFFKMNIWFCSILLFWFCFGNEICLSCLSAPSWWNKKMFAPTSQGTHFIPVFHLHEFPAQTLEVQLLKARCSLLQSKVLVSFEKVYLGSFTCFPFSSLKWHGAGGSY